MIELLAGYIIALIMQWIIAYIIYNTTDSEIATFIFVIPFLPYFAGLGYVELFLLTLIAFSPFRQVLDNAYSFLSMNRKYKKLLKKLDKELETYTTLKKQSMPASQQIQKASSQQSLPQEAKAPTIQESQKTDQQNLTIPQQVSQQITTQQSSTPSTAQHVQATSQQSTQQTTPQTFSPQPVQHDTASQQIPQMISSQPTSQQQTSIQEQTASQQTAMRSTPRADRLIRHFEESLNNLQKIQGAHSEIYYRSVSLSYLNIIEIYLRKIYYGQPIKFHLIVQYFMVRGLISKNLGESLLSLSKKYWRLKHDPSFTVNKEFMQKVRSTAYQLLNEMKTKKIKLETLLIEKETNTNHNI